MVAPLRMGPGAAAPPAEAQNIVPGQAEAEILSVDQLDADEGQRVRGRRAERVLNAPRQLADLPPADQLAACERIIRSADDAREGTVRDARNRAAAHFFDTAGPYLMWIRDNELFALGRPGRTFEMYITEVWGYGTSQAYLYMDAAVVRAALGLAGTDEYAVQGIPLTTKHVRAIAPALRATRTPQIASQMWRNAAEEDGKVTEQTLKAAQKRLAVAVPPARTESNSPFDSSDRAEESNMPSNDARRRTNEILHATAEELERVLDRLDRIAAAGVAPLDPRSAERDVNRIRAAGRRLNRTTTVPADVVDAEIID